MTEFMNDQIASDIGLRQRRHAVAADHHQRTFPARQAIGMRNEHAVGQHDDDLAGLGGLRTATPDGDWPQPETTAGPGKHAVPMRHGLAHERDARISALRDHHHRRRFGQRDAIAPARLRLRLARREHAKRCYQQEICPVHARPTDGTNAAFGTSRWQLAIEGKPVHDVSPSFGWLDIFPNGASRTHRSHCSLAPARGIGTPSRALC